MTKTITDAGIALLTAIANGAGEITWTLIKTGDGDIGAGDPAALTDIISVKQSFDVVDVKFDSDGTPYVFFVTNNDGLATGYDRREIGIFGKATGDAGDGTLIAYISYTAGEAAFVPADTGVAETASFRFQIVESADLTASVTIDPSIVYLPLDRWADHLAGAGGVDQHPIATSSAPGLLGSADKSKMDTHINLATPSKGTAIHGVATTAAAGFMSTTDKVKLDGIEAEAEVNQFAYSRLYIFGQAEAIAAEAKDDYFILKPGPYVNLSSGSEHTVTIGVSNVAPLTHVGSRGTAHGNATALDAGFMSAAHYNKLEGIATNAEVNQNAFSTVRVGSTNIAADQKTDVLELAESDYVGIAADAVNDKVTFGLRLPYWTHKANYDPAIAVGDVLADDMTFTVGMHASPGGGIAFNAGRDVTYIGTHVFEMRVNNTSGSSVNRTLNLPMVDDILYYQIDSGAVTQIVASPGGINKTASISIPSGEHTLRLYLRTEGSAVCNLMLADWLDSTVIWAAGGTYY